MGPTELEQASMAAMRWNTPLSDAHAALLVDRLELPDAATVLDLGCGWGELLMRAVEGAGSLTATGVENDPGDVARGRAAAAARGLEDRVRFAAASAAGWSEPADRVLCVGASHIWGGTGGALTALAPLVAPGGRLLLGDGFWERKPSPAAVEIFGEEVVDLTSLVRLVHAGGWDVLHLSVADQSEWDEFETTWRLGRHRWLAEHPDASDAAELRGFLQTRLTEYLDVYRGVLGFAYLVLSRAGSPAR